ncbi:hypothetical protein K504DRAFT_465825 [Pleomassaria siparia CBS 279.74]|uniref:Zn(2)-C6 fungal-type domain-containing protein n=1 Tax=Pleomassaria siparia CBS 279.74 TaxID=1314801 RepID=A0A6G1KD45_9PLEO|nr:hypothetical protein K504DRAFT_465825 [Pleomassaria siparia CBS 279.74]
MSSSTPSRSGRKPDKSPRSTPAGNTNSPPQDVVERSDVPCYTCRRRHVVCDRLISPTGCSKCAKRGIQCLGYQKPLRWADGVAVRGKFKGKFRPVVDREVVDVVRNTIQMQSSSAMQGTPDLLMGEISVDSIEREGKLVELMNYHNTIICAEQAAFEVPFGPTNVTNRKIAALSPSLMRQLPRDIVNCILGNAAVHMASRQSGSLPLEQLALESKVKVFHSFNSLLKSPKNQRPDVIICVGLLIFSMDLLEHGMDRWIVHFSGSMNIMRSLGGIDNLIGYYPSLELPLTGIAFFETFWIVLSHDPTTTTKTASREAVAKLCHRSSQKQRFYNPCPMPLMLAVWDIGTLSSRILQTRDAITFGDMHKRDQVLTNVLSFQPDEQNTIKQDTHNMAVEIQKLVGTAWKSAITVLVFRYLYFGRSNLAPRSQMQHSPTPSHTDPGPYYQGPEDTSLDDSMNEMGDADELDEHLSTSPYLTDPLPRSSSPYPSLLPFSEQADYLTTGYFSSDPLSRSPSPLPSPQFPDPPDFGLWDARYIRYNEAYSSLAASFHSMHNILDDNTLRYILMPLIILALVSKKGSNERKLCHSYFSRFKDHMTNPGGQTCSSPQGGEALGFDIPWDKLDAYSDAAQRQSGSALTQENELKGAPEWNWWDMLKEMDMDMICKCF